MKSLFYHFIWWGAPSLFCVVAILFVPPAIGSCALIEQEFRHDILIACKRCIELKLSEFDIDDVVHGLVHRQRVLVLFHVGMTHVKDSMEVAENNMKIFTSSINHHSSNGTHQVVYLFNVVGQNNPLARLIPTDHELILRWDSSSSDFLTHIRTLELLGADITDQFNSIVFLNQESRGPLVKRQDGEWLGDFSRLLSVEGVGLVGATISCETAPHVQTHAFAVKPAMIPTMSALRSNAVRAGALDRDSVEVDLSVWARNANFQIGSILHSKRGHQDSFSECLTPDETSPRTVTSDPTSWCDLKTNEVVFQKWGGLPLRTNGIVCEAAKDNMRNTLMELQKAEPSLDLAMSETLIGGAHFDLYQQYQQEVQVMSDYRPPIADVKVCFLVRAYDSSEKAAESQFIHYGLPSLISSLQKQNDPNWLAVFVNSDNRDYFSALAATVGSYSDARLKTIDIPKEFRPAFTTADAGYTATDYALREMETWAQCKYITVTNSDNIYGTEIVQRVLTAHVRSKKAAPDMLLAPLDSRHFAYQDLSNRGLEREFTSRCTEIMAMLDFNHLAATAQPIPKLGKVDLASMFFNREKLAKENLNFNDVMSPMCPGCQDGLFAEFLIQSRAWNYQRMPIDGMKSIVFHGPSPTLCIASGNVWFDYPLVNGVGCYSHRTVVSMQHDPAVNTAYDWGNFERNDRMCLRVNEDAFLNVLGVPFSQRSLSTKKLAEYRQLESSISPGLSPSIFPSQTPSNPQPSTIPHEIFSSFPTYTVRNTNAFTGVDDVGNVVTWGATAFGSNSSAVMHLLTNVTAISGSSNAFSAIRADGTLVVWGQKVDISKGSQLGNRTRISTLAATQHAFAGVTADGAAISYGAASQGGVVPVEMAVDLTEGVVSVVGNAGAFAALKVDGSVYCWGNKFAGGGVSTWTRSDLKEVQQVFASLSSFAALRTDGSVVVWGDRSSGGDMHHSVAHQLTSGVVHIVSNSGAFVAIKADGRLVPWGRSEAGGNYSEVHNLFGISELRFIAHTDMAFAVLRRNGTVLSWGSAVFGGDSDAVSSQLTNITTIVATRRAFAALSGSGGVVTWGDVQSGGYSENPKLHSGVTKLYATRSAFAALRNDGSVVVWGNPHFGGAINNSEVAFLLNSSVKFLCANEVAFTAIRFDGSAVFWGHSSSVGEGGLLPGNYSSIDRCTI